MARPKKVEKVSIGFDLVGIEDSETNFIPAIIVLDEIIWKGDCFFETEDAAINDAKGYLKKRLAFLLR